MTLVPGLKLLESLLYAIYFNECPWDNTEVAKEAYLRMAKVTNITFTYTFIHAFMFLLCKGWSTTTHQVDRNQATNLTMVMGLIYLVYSAYFLSSDFPDMQEFVNLILAVIYFILGMINLKSVYGQIQLVKEFLHNADENVP